MNGLFQVFMAACFFDFLRSELLLIVLWFYPFLSDCSSLCYHPQFLPFSVAGTPVSIHAGAGTSFKK
jgi:hypothetical protein